MPRAWVILRWGWFAAVTGCLGMALLLPLMKGTFVRLQLSTSPLSWIALSTAFMLFLLPHDDRDVVVCSPRELLRWQVKSLLGAFAVGVASLICAAHAVANLTDGPLIALCCAGMLCLLVAPWLFRLCAWRLWTGMALLVVGLLA